MTSLFRSEDMTLCQLFLQSEAAFSCINELGKLGVVEFKDLNANVNAFQRKFVNELRRCEEMERQLRFLQKEIELANIPFIDETKDIETPYPKEMIDLQAQFDQLEAEMKESNANQTALRSSFLELVELKYVLKKTQSLFDEGIPENLESSKHSDYVPIGAESELGFVAGTILRKYVVTFERLLWRASNGNAYFKHSEIEEQLYDPSTRDQVNKCVFIIFFQGDNLKTKVKKICSGFHAILYPCPETTHERREMVTSIQIRIEDLQTVMNQTEDHRNMLLQTMTKHMKSWFVKVQKLKGVYHVMNMLNIDVTQKCLIGECWTPVTELDNVQRALQRGTQNSGASVPSILNRMNTKEQPPTYNRTNKVTRGFQAIIDAYGVADYKEVNPALYTVITFPFLFSVMFGDMGHGFIMACFAFWMIWKEKQLAAKKNSGEMFDMIFSGRYIIFMMGLFSVHSGLLYNDAFSKSLNVFGSGWVDFNGTVYNSEYVAKLANSSSTATITLDPKYAARDTPYYFGIDPVWQISKNKLTFTNSLKMKLSIIFGVSHMMFGVVLSIFNHIYFKKTINIFCEFIPQLLFISCIFGYLVILIFYKWIVFSIHDKYQPSLLIGLINMFLKFGKKIDDADLVYQHQSLVQPILVAVAVISVPWMLLVKPFYLRRQYYQRRNGYQKLSSGNSSSYVTSETSEIIYSQDGRTSESLHVEEHHEEEEDEEFDFGEVFIHQCIHTIEYCLGCISNTASYLRLWALSLAHAQLSEVLWDMEFKIILRMGGNAGSIAIFLVFAAWAVETIVILLIMEGLSAFLHTLRLHWVEFNSKFYHGTGYKFQPFSFQQILKDNEIC